MATVQAPANAALPDRDFPVGPHQNIVLLGDSITNIGQWGQIMQDMVDRRYPLRQIRVLNRGVFGDTARGALARLDTDVVAARPDWVLVNFGINDRSYPVDAALGHYEVLLNRLLRDTNAQIMVVSPQYPDREEPEEQHLAAYVRGIKALADKYGLRYIPLYERMKGLRRSFPTGVKYAPDGLHPNLIGSWMIAEIVLQEFDFPLYVDPVPLSIPSRRATADCSDKRDGIHFSIPLTSPLNITLTNPPLPVAYALAVDTPPHTLPQ